jgi:hypothetical protein
MTPDRRSTIRRAAALAGQEVGPGVGRDRKGEALDRQLGEGNALNALLRDPDRVEGDVDRARLLGDCGRVVLDRLLVDRVHASSLRHATFGSDCLGHGLEVPPGCGR